MDAATTAGLNITVVGVGTVFLALSMLVVVLTIMGRILAGETGKDPGPEASSDDSGRDVLERVALAAYGLHAASRTAVRPPEPASAWLRAARSQQVMR